MNIVSGGIAEH